MMVMCCLPSLEVIQVDRRPMVAVSYDRLELLHFIGNDFGPMNDWFSEDPHLAWAFYGHRLNLYRQTAPHPGFSQLLELGRTKPHGYSVFTSNVDGQFQRAGFAAEQMVECHGSIHHFQCTASCTDEIWDAKSESVQIDEAAFRATVPLPRCRDCSALARPNILMFNDRSWLGHRRDAQQERFAAWFDGLAKSLAKLAVIELGAGSAIATVRLTSERVVDRIGGKLIRINPREHDVPTGQIGAWVASSRMQQGLDLVPALAELVLVCAAGNAGAFRQGLEREFFASGRRRGCRASGGVVGRLVLRLCFGHACASGRRLLTAVHRAIKCLTAFALRLALRII